MSATAGCCSMNLPVDARPLKILHLEDRPPDAELIHMELRRGGVEFTATCVDTREGFLAALGNCEPDVMLLDYEMPGFDGMTALRLAQERLPDVPAIIVTGSANEEIAVACMQAGAADYVLKSHLARLVPGVRYALKRQRERERDIRERKEAEVSLRASEERLRILFEFAPDAIFLIDLTGIFVDANRAMDALTGYAHAEIIGRSFVQLSLLDVKGALKAGTLLARSALGQPTGPDEFVVHRKDGGTVGVEVRSFPVTMAGKRFALGIARDISERQQAEALVQQFARRNQQILESAGDGILGIDVHGRVTFANGAAARLVDREIGDLVGEIVCTVIEGDGHAPDTCRVLAAMRAGACFRDDDMAVTRKGGGRLAVRCVMSPTVEDGELTGAVLLLEDVTLRRHTEEALRRSEAGLRSLVENAPYGIYRTSLDGRFLAANPALVKMLGYDSWDEMSRLDVGRNVYADPAERDRLVSQSHDALEIGLEIPWKRQDGTSITVRVSGRAVRDDRGESLGFEMMAEDVTGRRVLEAQLRQAQKMEAVGRLTGGIAHDFNNELSVILMNAQLAAAALERGLAVEPSDLHDIEDAAQRAATMTRSLLGFSRQADLVLAPTDLARVVGNLSKMLRRMLPESILMRINADQPVPAVQADPGAVEQMLLNLATNARDAMPDGGVLRLSVAETELDEAYASDHAGARPGKFVTVAVSDTGIGMDAETKARIFDPFFTTKAPGVGTGLGLAMVYGLTKQHGGYVNVYSEPGLGSTFRLYFPAVAGDAAPQRRRDSAADVCQGSETILLVEDEAPLRRAGKRVLEAFGYTVLTAADGEEALETCRTHPAHIDLVISDLVMPRMSGRQLYDALRREVHDVKFILASGYTGWEAKERDSMDGSVPFVQKPWQAAEVGRLIREVLDGG